MKYLFSFIFCLLCTFSLFHQLIQAKCFPIVASCVSLDSVLSETLQIETQMNKLLILFVRGEGKDWHAIVELKEEREDRVVHYDHLRKLSVLDDPQILHKT